MNQGIQPARNVDKAEEEMHWLALRLVPGLGARVAMRLVKNFGSATGVFQASSSELEALGVASHVVRNIATGTVFEDAIQEVEKARQLGALLISVRDVGYPQMLKEIFDPPLLLYAQG